MGRMKEAFILNCIIPMADWKFGTSLYKAYKDVGRLLHLLPEEIRAWQTDRMKERIRHAYEHIPYYRNIFEQLHLSPDNFRTLDDLQHLPVLTKDDIRKYYDELIPDDIARYPYHNGATGGSTGMPMRYLTDNKSWSMTNAFNIWQRHKTGYHYGDEFIGMGGSSIGSSATHSFAHSLYYRLIGKRAMGSSGVNEEELQRYVDFICLHHIKFVYGYASVIFLFAKYVIDTHQQHKMNIQVVFPTSDILTPNYAETIVKAFGCKILDSYGAFDGCVSGYRSLWEDTGFHCGYSTYIETDNSVAPNNGRILVTDLIGHAFPFIRYDLGDVVEIDTENSYSYIFNGQVLKSVQGRTSNLIKLPDGFYLSEVSLHNAFKDVHIDAYRVDVADRDIIVTVVPSEGYSSAEEEEMMKIISDRTGNSYHIIVKHSNTIERRKNGKSLYIMTATPV